MLDFVHVSGANGGQDVHDRKKVRSQAMRDFRRRQRAERDASRALNSDGKSDDQKITKLKKRLSVPGQPSTKSDSPLRRRAASADSCQTDTSSYRASDRELSTKSTPVVQAPKDGESTFQMQQPMEPIEATLDLAAIDAMGQWQYSMDVSVGQSLDFPYWPSGSSRDQSPFVHQDIASWTTEAELSYQVPASVSQLMGMCPSCGSHLASSWCPNGYCGQTAWPSLEQDPVLADIATSLAPLEHFDTGLLGPGK